jgi:hypothetical protein
VVELLTDDDDDENPFTLPLYRLQDGRLVPDKNGNLVMMADLQRVLELVRKTQEMVKDATGGSHDDNRVDHLADTESGEEQ